MCGRFTRFQSWREIHSYYQLLSDNPPEGFRPRFNVAPGQPVEIVASRKDGTRGFGAMQWGLVPSWAKDPSVGFKMINARSETIAEKPAFRQAFARRRCVIPASGFYEWQDQGGKQKQPFHFTRPEGGPLSFAGLWERWTGADSPLYTFTIITTAANATMSAYHARMPVILSRQEVNQWLDPQASQAGLLGLCRALPDDGLAAHPVSRDVNRVANDNPALIEPVAEAAGLL